MYKVIGTLISVAVVFGAGMFTGVKIFEAAPEIKIVEKKEIVYQTITRDYQVMTQPEIIKELYKYDTAVPRLDGTVSGNVFHATAGFHEREWSRDFVLASGTSRGWRTYFVVAGAGALAGGYLIYKIKK